MGLNGREMCFFFKAKAIVCPVSVKGATAMSRAEVNVFNNFLCLV